MLHNYLDHETLSDEDCKRILICDSLMKNVPKKAESTRFEHELLKILTTHQERLFEFTEALTKNVKYRKDFCDELFMFSKSFGGKKVQARKEEWELTDHFFKQGNIEINRHTLQFFEE